MNEASNKSANMTYQSMQLSFTTLLLKNIYDYTSMLLAKNIYYYTGMLLSKNIYDYTGMLLPKYICDYTGMHLTLIFLYTLYFQMLFLIFKHAHFCVCYIGYIRRRQNIIYIYTCMGREQKHMQAIYKSTIKFKLWGKRVREGRRS